MDVDHKAGIATERSDPRRGTVAEERAEFDVQRVRADFPILARTVRGKPLVYLDNAATTQKPQVVLDAIASYYTTLNAHVHRGVHELGPAFLDGHSVHVQIVPYVVLQGV